MTESEFKHKTELHCKYCNTRVWSRYSGHFNGHTCVDAGRISKRYNHKKGDYEPDFPFMAIDETEHYCRILGDPKDFTVVEVSHEVRDSEELDDGC